MHLKAHPPHPRSPHPWEANRVLRTTSSTLDPLHKHIWRILERIDSIQQNEVHFLNFFLRIIFWTLCKTIWYEVLSWIQSELDHLFPRTTLRNGGQWQYDPPSPATQGHLVDYHAHGLVDLETPQHIRLRLLSAFHSYHIWHD
jgi:hypothetical protein